jgi:hypothetical protein
MVIGQFLNLPPQWVAAIVIAAPMLACGTRFALLVVRISAWYALRWQTLTNEQFLTDRLFSSTRYGILAAPGPKSTADQAEGGGQG